MCSTHVCRGNKIIQVVFVFCLNISLSNIYSKNDENNENYLQQIGQVQIVPVYHSFDLNLGGRGEGGVLTNVDSTRIWPKNHQHHIYNLQVNFLNFVVESTSLSPLWSTIYNQNNGQIYNLHCVAEELPD